MTLIPALRNAGKEHVKQGHLVSETTLAGGANPPFTSARELGGRQDSTYRLLQNPCCLRSFREKGD